ncbi:MAG: hypothetical protein ACLUFT_11210 [Gemmiger formicilis]|uniref:hypothetical protein n=1 Tax=Gemmiger formicilis TaxID=745368 RepID=UPI0039912AA0
MRDLTSSDDAKRTEQCNIIVDETDRLSTLVNSVMELSKVQSGAEKPNLVDFDMGELCFEVAGRYVHCATKITGSRPGRRRLPGER